MSRVSRLGTAVSVEWRKLMAAPVAIAAAALTVVGISVIVGAITGAVEAGDPEIAAKLGAIVQAGGWRGYLAAAAQVTSAGALLAFGVIVSWLFGREFADGTITGLFALPVSLATTALAKLLVFLMWATAVALLLTAALLGGGVAIGLGALDEGAWAALARQFILAELTALLAIPAALASTLGRGLLTGIAVTVGLIASAQILVLAGASHWYPVAAPALWAFQPDSVPPLALALAAGFGVVFAFLTAFAWSRLQLDR